MKDVNQICRELCDRLEEQEELGYDPTEGYYWKASGERLGVLRTDNSVTLVNAVRCDAFLCLPEHNPSHYDQLGRHYPRK